MKFPALSAERAAVSGRSITDSAWQNAQYADPVTGRFDILIRFTVSTVMVNFDFIEVIQFAIEIC